MNTVKPCDRVLAVGNPRLGLHNGLSEGVVTFANIKGTEISNIRADDPALHNLNYTHHTAQVANTDVGSALVTTDGHVIGLNMINVDLGYTIAYQLKYFAGLIMQLPTFHGVRPAFGAIAYWLTDELRDELRNKSNIPPNQIPVGTGIVIWHLIDYDNYQMSVWSREV
ncbi:unnamed protein product [Medioppia subpectinata]|uniref:Uncharacterized protein n=1 Tax=Medioppia subpectinata TaxID=1979941 RepID=A0A7R9LYA8_9ACAR|nr:unnamed protein product [Medioppia subpectinata]CAG2122789.1 unnamed protein product [Medioppia subpectinata]